MSEVSVKDSNSLIYARMLKNFLLQDPQVRGLRGGRQGRQRDVSGLSRLQQESRGPREWEIQVCDGATRKVLIRKSLLSESPLTPFSFRPILTLLNLTISPEQFSLCPSKAAQRLWRAV